MSKAVNDMRASLRSLLALCAFTSLISGCGGGSGGGEPTASDTTASASATTETAELTTPGLRWRGVNLSGAEYNSTLLPGRYGFEYFYPNPTSVDYFQSKGMNLIRLPFLWERVQPTLYTSLDPTELQRLVSFVNSTTAKGITVLIDPHNYGRYRQQVIGSAGVPHTAFGDFWYRLAVTFKNNPKVLFGLMNEPYGMTTENWVGAANEAIRRIRLAGATNTIAVPGNAWSGAYSWHHHRLRQPDDRRAAPAGLHRLAACERQARPARRIRRGEHRHLQAGPERHAGLHADEQRRVGRLELLAGRCLGQPRPVQHPAGQRRGPAADAGAAAVPQLIFVSCISLSFALASRVHRRPGARPGGRASAPSTASRRAASACLGHCRGCAPRDR
jgi:hypothetical protein